jgi:hypothetical protein
LRLVVLALSAVLVLEVVRFLAAPDPLAALGGAGGPPLALSPPPPSSASPSPPPPASPSPSLSTSPSASAPQPGENAVQASPQPPAAPPLPPEYAAIEASGILGKTPEPKPPPPALIGLAGAKALIQAPTGRWDFAAEGEAVDGVKVLRIGVNRVLVEYEGKTQELTIFSGLGGSSLLPPPPKDPKP